MNRSKVVVFTGAGMSAPSGIPTFRGGNGLWRNFRFEDVASPEAWAANPQLVLEFYNERRAKAAEVEPNAGHRAIVELEQKYDVVVVTQNVDDLHERAGSKNVVHLHGELRKARSSREASLIYDIGAAPIQLGDHCEKGSQLRPHIVWFGEEIMNAELAVQHIEEADRVLVVGTSLVVWPAAGFIRYARKAVTKVIVDLDVANRPDGFEVFEGSADVAVLELVKTWIGEVE